MKVESHVFTDTNLWSLSGRMALGMEFILEKKCTILSTFSGVSVDSTGSKTFYGVIFFREETK